MASITLLNTSTLEELFPSAINIENGSTINNTSSANEFFIYRLSKGTSKEYQAKFYIYGEYSGDISVYNNKEVLKAEVTVDNGVGFYSNEEKYSVTSEYYLNVYDADEPSRPIAVNYLNSLTGEAIDDYVQFTIQVSMENDVYVMLHANPANFSFSVEVVETGEDVPAEPYTPPSEPAVGEVVVIEDAAVYDFTMPAATLQACGPAKIQFRGTFSNILRIILRFGARTFFSNYVYIAQANNSIDLLKGQAAAAVGNPNLEPIALELDSDGYATIVEFNIDAQGEPINVSVESPIPGTKYEIQSMLGTLKSTDTYLTPYNGSTGRRKDRGNIPAKEVRRRLRLYGYI